MLHRSEGPNLVAEALAAVDAHAARNSVDLDTVDEGGTVAEVACKSLELEVLEQNRFQVEVD